MLKFFFLFFLSVYVTFASEINTATKIVKAITSVVNTNTAAIWIEKEDKSIEKFLDIKAFQTSEECEDIGVFLIKKPHPFVLECANKPIVVLDYDLLKKYDNAVAAFFWKKGRPNIVFIKDRVEKFNIKLPKPYEVYQEEIIW